MIDMKSKYAINLGIAELNKSWIYHAEEALTEVGLYRYLYQSGEQHEDKKRQVTDFIWSKNPCRLDQVMENPGNYILHYLRGGPDIPFVHEELIYSRQYLGIS